MASSVQNAVTTSVMSLYDATYYDTTLRQEYYKSLIDLGNDNYLSDYLLIVNSLEKRTTANDRSSWHELPAVKPAVLVEALADPGAGVSATYTVQAADIDVSLKTFPLVYDVYRSKNGTMCLCTAKPTASTFTLRPLRAADTIGAILAGDLFTFEGTAFPEEGTAPDGRVRAWNRYLTTMQIMRGAAKSSGSQLTNETQWTTIEMVDGGTKKPMNSIISTSISDMELNVWRQYAHTFFWGVPGTNTGVNRTTEGLDYAISQRGITHDLGASTFDDADLDTITTLIKARAGFKNCYLGMMTPTDLGTLRTAITADLANVNLMNYVETTMGQNFFGGGDAEMVKNLTATFNLNAVDRNNMRYVLYEMKMASDPNGAGYSSGNRIHRNFFIPINTTKAAPGAAVTGRSCMTFKQGNGKRKRYMDMVTTGRQAPIPTSTEDIELVDVLSEVGFEHKGVANIIRTIHN